MFKNHLKIAFRQIAQNKVFSTLNILGLSLGMALVILTATFIKSEFSYDTWMADSEDVYRVYRVKENFTAWTPSPLAGKMIADYPEVANATGWSPQGERLLTYAGNDMYIKNTASVDSNFFDVLKMDFLYGNAGTALKQVNSMVISDNLSKRIFGDADPIGETVKYNGGDDYIISGVLNTESRKSHIKSDILTPFTWYSNGWAGNNRTTYARLKHNADPAQLAAKIDQDATEIIREEYVGRGMTPVEADFFRWALQPLDEVYLHSKGWTSQSELVGSIRNVYIFGFIGILVLLVAIINYVNLTTARSSQRSKEVGVRKVAGAGRGLLTTQFITESLFQAIVAGFFALLLAELFLPFFNKMMDRELQVLPGEAAWVIFGTLGMALLTGFLAGIYPAFIMSAFKPSTALKSNFMKSGGGGAFRKILVTGQFAASITLLIVMAFVYKQVNYMMEKDLGFHPDQVLTIPLNDDHSHRKVEDLKNRFMQVPGVQVVTSSSSLPGQFVPDWNVMIEGSTESPAAYVMFADADFDEAIEIEMVSGRFMDAGIGTDSTGNFVVNEKFVEQYHLENPLGQKMKFSWQDEMGQIVGVMKDFHYFGMEKEVEPLVMNSRHWRNYVSIKLSTTDMPKTIGAIKELWAEVEPAYPMRYSFLDDDFATLYAEQERFGTTILYYTFLTLFIALLGLFGLTAFSVERRTREIGIRKVLGSSINGIIGLLAQDFMKLLGIAFLISLPVGYLLSSRWLEDFAYRTEMVWWVFLGAGITILSLGFLTVCLQSVRAALANPVESLRSE